MALNVHCKIPSDQASTYYYYYTHGHFLFRTILLWDRFDTKTPVINCVCEKFNNLHRDFLLKNQTRAVKTLKKKLNNKFQDLDANWNFSIQKLPSMYCERC